MLTLTFIGTLIYFYGLYMFISDLSNSNWDIDNIPNINRLRFFLSGTSAAITIISIILFGLKIIVIIFHLIITYLP